MFHCFFFLHSVISSLTALPNLDLSQMLTLTNLSPLNSFSLVSFSKLNLARPTINLD